jgi:serine/threonine protein kinase
MQLEHIGKYKILEKIGQGAMGEVYKAHDSVLNRWVAVKTISTSLAGDDTLRKRFEREAQSAARLNHPNIITVYDFGEEHDKIYMAMELLEGNDLKHAIAKGKLPNLDQKIDLMAQICDGLAFAHQHEIVHRDLKPANIHLQPNGQVKIMDFGLARLGGSEMTRTGMVMGTPHYMSPEQVRGERVDARSDVFALGCVFYELLTGRKPFDAESMHSVLFKVMQEDPPPISDLAREVPFVLMEMTERALDKDPSLRYQDAGELRAALHLAQKAIAEGRGDDPLPQMPRREAAASGGPAAAADAPGGEAARAAAGSRNDRSASGVRPERAATASRARSRPLSSRVPAPAPPPPVPPRSRLPWIAVVVLPLIVAAIGTALFLNRDKPPQATATASIAQKPSPVGPVEQELAASQSELARKQLDAGDYKTAAERARRALKVDPNNAQAQRIVAEAEKLRETVEAAASAATAAASSGNPARAGQALWDLILVDPTHELIDRLGPGQESRFQDRVAEARRLMSGARGAAEQARANGLESFRAAAALATDAETAVKQGQFLTAARKYIQARDLFERARKAAV